MLVNFENVLLNDFDEFLVGDDYERNPMHASGEIQGLWLHRLNIKKQEIWILKPSMHCPDVKIHFKDYESAKKLYDFLIKSLENKCEFIHIDILKFGAL